MTTTTTTNNIDIVVSRYGESLDWLLEQPFSDFAGSYIVYNKGPNDNFVKQGVKKIIPLSNFGRCDHTYLYHIVHHYHQLANITVFLPGSINITDSIHNDPYKKKRATLLFELIKKQKRAIFLAGIKADKGLHHDFQHFSLEEWSASDPANMNTDTEQNEKSKSKLDLCKIRPYGNWYNYFFGNLYVPYGCYWGIFSIGKRDILNHPIEHYEKFLTILSKSSNPEAGHYVERSWGAIFHPLKWTKVLYV